MGMGLPGLGGGGGGGGGLLGGLPGIGGAGNGGTLIGQGGINLSGIPFIGGMFPNPNEAANRDAMAAAGQAYGNMRPQMAQGYQNIASQFQNQLAPVHQALDNMYGQHGQNSDVTANIAAQQPPMMASGANQGAMAGLNGAHGSQYSGPFSQGVMPGVMGTIFDPGGMLGIGNGFLGMGHGGGGLMGGGGIPGMGGGGLPGLGGSGGGLFGL